MHDLLRAPALHNTGKAHLFGIVRDEGTKLKDGTAIVTVWAPEDVRLGHSGPERA